MSLRARRLAGAAAFALVATALFVWSLSSVVLASIAIGALLGWPFAIYVAIPQQRAEARRYSAQERAQRLSRWVYVSIAASAIISAMLTTVGLQWKVGVAAGMMALLTITLVAMAIARERGPDG